MVVRPAKFMRFHFWQADSVTEQNVDDKSIIHSFAIRFCRMLFSILLSLNISPLGEALTLFLVQIIIIISLIRLLGMGLRYLNQPSVIGEIIAGILLGPSVLGNIPNFSNSIFPPSSLPTIQLFANIGLIFFMFFLGMEVEPKVMSKLWQSSLPIAMVSIMVPFAVGCGIAAYLWDIDHPVGADFTSFMLFIGTAFSFTAFPVLARILTSANLLTHMIGLQTLGAAAIDDVAAWCILASRSPMLPEVAPYRGYT